MNEIEIDKSKINLPILKYYWTIIQKLCMANKIKNQGVDCWCRQVNVYEDFFYSGGRKLPCKEDTVVHRSGKRSAPEYNALCRLHRIYTRHIRSCNERVYVPGFDTAEAAQYADRLYEFYFTLTLIASQMLCRFCPKCRSLKRRYGRQ